MAVTFSLDSRPNKHGEFPIRAVISIRGTVLVSTIGHSVNPDVWGNGRVSKAKYENSKGHSAKIINGDIIKVEAHFSKYEMELKVKPSKADLKEQMTIALGKGDVLCVPVKVMPKDPSLFDRLEEFIREQAVVSQWAYATKQCWKTFTNHLTKFSKKVKFEDFNESGLNKYLKFLRVTENLEEKTVQKQYTMLKWFITWAVRKEYTKHDYINRYKVKFKILQKPVIFLTKEQLLKLYKFEIPANQTVVKLHNYEGEEYEFKVEEAGALAKTRNLFCFCAFTSLRYSDMAKVKRIDIAGDILYVTTQKTNDRLPIDLNAMAKSILDKYKDEKFPDDLALPVISNQKMNKYLKDLCELCEFNEPITQVFYRAGERVEETYPKYELIGTHAARRTFICFALSNGIAPQVVMKWTGHSDYKAMKPYIDIAEKTKAEAMNVFEKGFNGITA